MSLSTRENPREGNDQLRDRVCELLKPHGTIVDVKAGEKPSIVILMKQFHGNEGSAARILTDRQFAEQYIRHQDAIYASLNSMLSLSPQSGTHPLHYLIEGVPPPSNMTAAMKQSFMTIRDLDSRRQAGDTEVLPQIMADMEKNPRHLQSLMGPVRFAAQQLGKMDHAMLPPEPAEGRGGRVEAFNAARVAMQRKGTTLAELRSIRDELDRTSRHDEDALHEHIRSETSRFADEPSISIVVVGGGHMKKGTTASLSTSKPLEDYIVGSTVIIVEPHEYGALTKTILKQPEAPGVLGTLQKLGDQVRGVIANLFRK